MLLRVCLLTALASVSIAQLTSSCTTCSTNSNYGSSSSSGYGTMNNNVQRDDTGSSSNQPGYLPDYQGDRYTDPQRIAETQALNRAFFESIGGAPSPPPETPAQQGMNGASTASPAMNNGSTSTTYSPTSSAGYNTQYYNPSSATQNSQTGYRTGYQTGQTGTSGGQNQNFIAYDTTNQNSPYYYQRVPSTAQYNSVLGVNAGFPQGNRGVQFDQGANQNMNQNMNQMNQGVYSNQQNPQGYTTQFTYTSVTQNQNQPQMYGNQQMANQGQYSTQGYSNQQPMYDQTYSTQGYQGYGSSSTPSPQYNADSISCCSQVSSTCCYQTQSGAGGYSNQPTVQYSPSVYQYGKKR